MLIESNQKYKYSFIEQKLRWKIEMKKIVIYKKERKSPVSQHNRYCPTSQASGPTNRKSIPRFYHLGSITSSFLPFLIRDQQVIDYTLLCNNTKKEEITLKKDDNKSSNSRLSGSIAPD